MEQNLTILSAGKDVELKCVYTSGRSINWCNEISEK